MIMQEASYLMQHGVPAAWIVDKWKHHVIDPMGPNGSLFDAIADAFTKACKNYSDCDFTLDHMKRKTDGHNTDSNG